jgi:O-antigen ligase|tara:strand:- start:9312 stop:10406 length:1095 start_codon:yes stop_codon:yes gene_type:complete
MHISKEQTLNISIILILISAIISTCLSVNWRLSFYGTYQRYDGLLTFFCYLITYYTVIKVLSSNNFAEFSLILISLGFVVSVYALVQQVSLDPYYWKGSYAMEGSARPFSTLSHPNFLSEFLIMVLPFVYYKIAQGKKYYIFFAVIFIFAIFGTQTRAAFVALFVSGLYFVLLYKERFWFFNPDTRQFQIYIWRKINWKITVGIISIIIILNLSFPQTPLKRFFTQPSTINSRIDMWGVGVDMVKASPVFGIGLDNISEVYRYQYYYTRGEFPTQDQNKIHNEPLNIAIEKGLVGLGCWLFFLTIFFWIVKKKSQNPQIIVLSTSIVGYLIQNLFSFSVIPTSILFWFIIGMIIVYKNDKQTTY